MHGLTDRYRRHGEATFICTIEAKMASGRFEGTLMLHLFRILLAATFLWAGGLSASAQEAPAKDLGDELSDLLRGSQESTTERRVPFSRSDIQLSYAPLVRQTSPAVVNVYASAQVQARSPFMGDPFFEQFFGRQQMP